jgi:hypothetical protein
MTSTKRSYFEDMYGNANDPWDFEHSPYEQRKYELTETCLPHTRYRSAFEPGCSIGVLSEMLARRCDKLLATDIIPSAVATAAARVADHPNVVIEHRAIPDDWPPGCFDLVVLSEIGYYFDRGDLEAIMTRVFDSTERGAHIVGVHWRGVTDYPLSGDQTHELIDGTTGLLSIVHHVETAFLLDVWERA